MTRLHETRLIDDGAFMEFLHSHTNAVQQPGFSEQYYSGINPYALGFAMMRDIERICIDPTEEDRRWFAEIAGCGDPHRVLKDAWANYRDESFISQFLSPAVIRNLGLFHLIDDADEDEFVVAAIHDERGYLQVRRALARLYDVARRDSDIQIIDVDLAGDRRLQLRHHVVNGVTLHAEDAERVLRHLADLWGYHVRLVEADDEKTYTEHDADPAEPFI